MENKKKIGIFFVSLFFVTLVYAQVPPDLPDHFKGNLIVNGENAPIGTSIKIYVNSKLEDTIESTVLGKYDLYVKTGNSGNQIKFYANEIEAGTATRQSGKNVDLNLEIESTLLGNESYVDTNINNLSIKFDNQDISYGLTGNKTVDFLDNNEKIITFEFDFDNKVLDLTQLEIKKQTSVTEGSIIIKGMPAGITKTAYVDKLTSDNNAVCIKDSEISSITEISNDCNGADEVLLACPGSSNGYSCALENGKFKVTGLQHSGVREDYIAPSTPSSGGSSSGGGGGGGSGGSKKSSSVPQEVNNCVEDWECQDWSQCEENGVQKRSCSDKNNCGTTNDLPEQVRSCTYEKIVVQESKNLEEVKNEASGDELTGAVIGTGKTGSIILVISSIVVLGLLALFLNRLWKNKK